MSFKDLFGDKRPIIGMVHLLPLPGSPKFNGSIDDIYIRALADTYALERAGIDALIVENFGDEPYTIGEPEPEQIALMAAVTREVKLNSTIPVGVNVQFNAWKAEIAIAMACEAQFVRVEVFVDTVISAQGMVNPCSAQITRYRHMLGAKSIQIWADVQTKYTQNVIAQPIRQSAKDAEAAGADAIIVTGGATGQATPMDAIADAAQAVNIPVLAGSGTTIHNVQHVLQIASGAIVGSSLKQNGIANHAVSVDKTAKFMKTVRAITAEGV